MNQLNKLIIVLLILSSTINYSQEFNGYKYLVVSNMNYNGVIKDKYGIQGSVIEYLNKIGYTVISGGEHSWPIKLYPKDLRLNNCLGLYVEISHKAFPPYEVTLNFLNCKNESIKLVTGKAQRNFENALNKIYDELNLHPYYFYDESLTPKKVYPVVEKTSKNVDELKVYFDSTKLDPIEGIYKTYKTDSYYKLGIVKDGDFYKAIVIECDYPHWEKGDVKAIFESTAAEGVFSTKYYMGNKTSIETFSSLEGGLINIEIRNSKGENEDMKLLKLYPKN